MSYICIIGIIALISALMIYDADLISLWAKCFLVAIIVFLINVMHSIYKVFSIPACLLFGHRIRNKILKDIRDSDESTSLANKTIFKMFNVLFNAKLCYTQKTERICLYIDVFLDHLSNKIETGDEK